MTLYIRCIFNTVIIYTHIYIWYISIYNIYKVHSSDNFITHIPEPDLPDCKDL